MLAYALASKPCSEATNIGYPLSSGAVFGLPRMDCSRVMVGRFGGEVGRFLLALREMRKFEIYKEYLVDGYKLNSNFLAIPSIRRQQK